MKHALESIKLRHTTTINGHVVTRWSETSFEVDTWGRKTVDIEEALAEVRK